MTDISTIFSRLQAETDRAATWLPGVVNWTPGAEIEDLAATLPDGVHRLDGSEWQFTVEGGALVRACRADMGSYLSPETVHPAA